MPLPIGARLGPYEILSSLGAGGMGEVYRARDSKLHRDVAIKVLPDLFAQDPERRARFEREAQALASLNNPHIAQVYGVVEPPAALVMELVDGDDLAVRLAAGRLPVREAIEIAIQVADALQAAHDNGIVHRDLKPANIKVRDDGTVKVLDFGLAKATGHAIDSPVSLDSPTFTSPGMTQMGVILGTAAYMAPEQAKGKPVDRGADMWGFGAVLYEMLAGAPAFAGETVTDVLAAIVTREPDWTRLPDDTPEGVRRLLKRCLERDRRRRLADAGEARHQLEESLASPVVPLHPGGVDRYARLRTLVPWAIASALAMGIVALILNRNAGREQPASVRSRFSIELPPKASLVLSARPAIAVSPDGRTTVFVAASEGVEKLYVRRLDSFDAVPLAGTEGATNPVISPDGRWVAFFNDTKLLKMSLTGGPTMELADANNSRGLSWDSDETITFAPTSTSGLYQVPAAGGAAVQVTVLTPQVERTHRWPQQLPDGTLIFTVGDFANPDSYETASIQAFVPRTKERRTVLAGAAMARYLPSGQLLFLRGTSLHAVGFDPVGLQVRGTPVTVLERVATDVTTGAAHFSLTPTGSLVYVESAAVRPVEVDRAGAVEPLPVPAGTYSDLAVSPDGSALAYSLISGGGRDVWIYNRARKTPSRLTFGGQNLTPIWSRDGSQVYFSRRDPAGRGSTLMRRRSDGSSAEESLITLTEQLAYLGCLRPDEKSAIIEIVTRGDAATDIYQVDLRQGARPTPVVVTQFTEYSAKLSPPDGKWLAYMGNESGRAEIYVRAANGNGRSQISNNGGEEPKWSRDGRQLYYRNGQLLMTVAIGSGASFESSPPKQILAGVYNLRTETGLSYDVDPRTDGFIMLRLAADAAGSNSIRVISGWTDEVAAALKK